jgi:capsular polysaccharide biosynthesis protein
LEEQEIRLDELFDALKKRWIMIVSITLVAAIISAVFSFFVIKPKFEASTKVFIGKEESDTQGYNQNDVMMYQKLMKTYSETIKTKDLVERALSDTNLDIKSGSILANLSVTSVADTQILQIKYTSNDPKEAAKVIEEITNEFIETSNKLVPNGNIQVIESVEVPEKPVSPNKKMNIAIAFLLGAMVGVGLAFLLEFLDNTFKSKDQVERELDIPVLGTIPKTKEDK